MQLLATHQTSEQIFSKNFGWRRDTFVLEHVKEEILFISAHTKDRRGTMKGAGLSRPVQFDCGNEWIGNEWTLQKH